MPIYTQKEYSEKVNKVNGGLKSPPEIKEKINDSKTDSRDIQKVYTFIYPENAETGNENVIWEITLEGKKRKIKIVNGIVRTTDEILANFLEKTGYVKINTGGQDGQESN